MNIKDICLIVASFTEDAPETINGLTVIPEIIQTGVMEDIGTAVAAHLQCHRRPGLTPAEIMRMLKEMFK